MKRCWITSPAIGFAMLLFAAGCGGDKGGSNGTPDGGTDTGTDSDADSDADTDTDTDSDSVTDSGQDTDTATDTDTDTDTGTDDSATVLFVGNSYTAANGLSALVEDLAAAAALEPAIATGEVTMGGATLEDHLTSTDAMAEIASGAWDTVVLQGQSQEPLIQLDVFLAAAADLAEAVFTSGGEPVFFETWAREEGHSDYDEPWTGGSPAAMQAALRDAYQQAADDSGGVYGPVGDAFEATIADHPEIGLYATDGSHPSMAGSYLAACVFVCLLSGEPLDSAPFWPAPLTEEEALALQDMAEQTVFE